MNNFMKPNLYYKDIYSINYKKLKDNNISYLLFDIDNTIADNLEKIPCQKALDFITELKEDFNIILISNSLPIRAKRFGTSLKVPYYSFSLKPFKKTYKKIIADFNLKTSTIAAIGDQIYTDIKGANKMKITSILVDRISDNESIITKFNRYRERILLNKYKIIERGKYDD